MKKNWMGEKFNKYPEEEQDIIRENVEKGKMRAIERAQERKDYEDELKEGRKYIHDNRETSKKIKVFYFSVGKKDKSFVVTAAVEIVKKIKKRRRPSIETRIRIAYAICNPKDRFSLKIAKGLVGCRLKHFNEFAYPYVMDQIIRNTVVNNDKVFALYLRARFIVDVCSHRLGFAKNISTALISSLND